MTMVSPARGMLVYQASKPDAPISGGASVAKGAGSESGGAIGDVMSGATSGITDVTQQSYAGTSAPDALKSWLPIAIVALALFFVWKYV
jgi:hypothetical protein